MTSDRGWGCMLRCGQMVVAQALINQHLGKSFNIYQLSLLLNKFQFVGRKGPFLACTE